MRPGSSLATPEAELVKLPASATTSPPRESSAALLDEAGVHDLKPTLVVRDIPMPHYAGADWWPSWREIGVHATGNA